MTQSREDRLASEAVSRLAGCPDADTLVRFHENRMDAPDRAEVQRHLENCEPCRTAADFLGAAGSAEPFPETLPDDVERRSEELLQGLGSTPAPRRSPWPLLLQVAAGLALLGALAVGGFSLLGPGRAPGDLGSLRGDEPLTLLEPAGDVGVPPAEMRWVHHPEAVRYRVDLFDEELVELWSHTTAGPEPVLLLGPAELELMVPGRRYTWRVTALNGFGASLGQSPAAHFEIGLP